MQSCRKTYFVIFSNAAMQVWKLLACERTLDPKSSLRRFYSIYLWFIFSCKYITLIYNAKYFGILTYDIYWQYLQFWHINWLQIYFPYLNFSIFRNRERRLWRPWNSIIWEKDRQQFSAWRHTYLWMSSSFWTGGRENDYMSTK